MTKTNTLVRLNEVSKHYAKKRDLFQLKRDYNKAVDGITIDIKEQETLGVVGESGCGKSTLGRTILRLEDITSGSVRFEDIDINEIPHSQFKKMKKDMQMIFQDPFASLDPRQQIGDAIEEPLIIHTKYTRKERKVRVKELLQEVGLREEHASKYPHEFSGGQRQRVGIARAIALNPKFIVCDEPVSALDVSVQAQIIKLLQEIQKNNNLTFMFISHDLGVVRYISDRVLVMYLGKMAELAPVDKLYSDPKHPYTKALISAIPRVGVNKNVNRIKLDAMGMEEKPPGEGCVFQPRCPLATSMCKEQIPVWREIDKGQFVACHHAEKSEILEK